MANLLTLAQAAKKLQVDYHTARQWILDGRLPASRPGRQWRIDEREIGRLMARTRHTPAVPTLQVATDSSSVSSHSDFEIPLPPIIDEDWQIPLPPSLSHHRGRKR